MSSSVTLGVKRAEDDGARRGTAAQVIREDVVGAADGAVGSATGRRLPNGPHLPMPQASQPSARTASLSLTYFLS